jgi:hypothetical protein
MHKRGWRMKGPKGHTVWLVALTVLLVIVLGLMGAMIWGQVQVVATTREALDQAIGWTGKLGKETFSYEFPVNADIPVVMDVPFEDSFRVPIEERVRVQTEIQIDEVVDVPLSTPLGTLNLRIPVRMTVPVDLEVPIEMEVDVPVETTIEVSTTVPFSMVVPVEIDLAETPLRGYLDDLHAELERLRSLLDDVAVLLRLGSR